MCVCVCVCGGSCLCFPQYITATTTVRGVCAGSCCCFLQCFVTAATTTVRGVCVLVGQHVKCLQSLMCLALAS